MFECSYGILAVSCKVNDDCTVNVFYFCGYEKEPDENDFRALREELRTNSEFGLVGREKEYRLMTATPDMVKVLGKAKRLIHNKGRKR